MLKIPQSDKEDDEESNKDEDETDERTDALSDVEFDDLLEEAPTKSASPSRSTIGSKLSKAVNKIKDLTSRKGKKREADKRKTLLEYEKLREFGVILIMVLGLPRISRVLLEYCAALQYIAMASSASK